MTSAADTAKVISSLHQNCDWLLKNFDTRRTAQNGEIVGILKLSLWIWVLTLSCTMSVSLQFERNQVLFKEFKTALEKKELDRKTNHQDVAKTGTEEICVLTKAIGEKETAALKPEQSARAVEAQEKAEALPPTLERQVSSGSVRCEVRKAVAQQRRVNVVACPSYLEHKAAIQEGVKNFHLCLSLLNNSLWEALEMKAHSEKSMNVSDVKVIDDDGFLSSGMTIKANNKIMKERTWINRVAQRRSFVT